MSVESTDFLKAIQTRTAFTVQPSERKESTTNHIHFSLIPPEFRHDLQMKRRYDDQIIEAILQRASLFQQTAFDMSFEVTEDELKNELSEGYTISTTHPRVNDITPILLPNGAITGLYHTKLHVGRIFQDEEVCRSFMYSPLHAIEEYETNLHYMRIEL
jgi:hypothetical protein